MKLVLVILSSYPLAMLNYQFKNPTLRLWYGLILGLILQYCMYGWDVLHLVVATCVTYTFMVLFGRKLSSFWIIGFNILHLSALHIKRMIDDYGGWSIDYTGVYMPILCKFSMLAFSYEDGIKKDEDIKNSYHRSK